jgi:hypothetical protein
VAGINFAHWNSELIRPRSLEQEPIEHASLALEAIFSHLQSPGKKTILDLGQVTKANVDFFSQFPCRLYIQNFFQEYANLLAARPESNVHDRMSEIFDVQGKMQFDVMICWDVFNYLEPKEVKEIGACMAACAKSGTYLLALVSSLSLIPREPRRYKILGKRSILEHIAGDETQSCRRYSQRELLSLLPGWQLRRSLHLRNSMQEHLFVYRP